MRGERGSQPAHLGAASPGPRLGLSPNCFGPEPRASRLSLRTARGPSPQPAGPAARHVAPLELVGGEPLGCEIVSGETALVQSEAARHRGEREKGRSPRGPSLSARWVHPRTAKPCAEREKKARKSISALPGQGWLGMCAALDEALFSRSVAAGGSKREDRGAPGPVAAGGRSPPAPHLSIAPSAQQVSTGGSFYPIRPNRWETRHPRCGQCRASPRLRSEALLAAEGFHLGAHTTALSARKQRGRQKVQKPLSPPRCAPAGGQRGRGGGRPGSPGSPGPPAPPVPRGPPALAAQARNERSGTARQAVTAGEGRHGSARALGFAQTVHRHISQEVLGKGAPKSQTR